ncbi:hypothetical protein J3A83DRAFT_464820 [Scleroderma citrinum]
MFWQYEVCRRRGGSEGVLVEGTPENPIDRAVQKKLQVDAGAQNISNVRGSGQPALVTLSGPFYGSQPNPATVYLGQLIRTDKRGRLIFIGGVGYSRSVGTLDTTTHFQPDITSRSLTVLTGLMSVKAGSTWRSNMPTSDRRYPRCTNPQLLVRLRMLHGVHIN